MCRREVAGFPMLNTARRDQYLQLMSDRGWDRLLLYGHAWRKDVFRSLVNFSFFRPHAAAVLSKSGDLAVITSHPWDAENIQADVDANISCNGNFDAAMESIALPDTAIAGMELM